MTCFSPNINIQKSNNFLTKYSKGVITVKCSKIILWTKKIGKTINATMYVFTTSPIRWVFKLPHLDTLLLTHSINITILKLTYPSLVFWCTIWICKASSFKKYGMKINPFVPELFGRARKNLIFHRGIEHYCFIILTRCWLGKPHSNHISLNRPRVWDSPHFLIEKIE